MNDLTKLTNKIFLCNLPCMAYQYYVLFYSKDFDVFMYRSNYVVLLYGVMNLGLLTTLLIQSYLQHKTNKKSTITIGIFGMMTWLILMLYYAILPLSLYYVIDGADKNITTVIFDKTEYQDLAENKLAICKTDQFCYIKVVKFRVYPTHGVNVDLDISPIKNLSIIIRPVKIDNIKFLLGQVILTGTFDKKVNFNLHELTNK